MSLARHRHDEPQGEPPIRALFAQRISAENAAERVQTERPDWEARVGVTAEGYVLTVSGAAPEEREGVLAFLETSGGRREPERGAHAPRPVQPGFTDAEPGIVPERTDLPAGEPEGPAGPFARQPDRLPDER